jgi:hypothetical protein
MQNSGGVSGRKEYSESFPLYSNSKWVNLRAWDMIYGTHGTGYTLYAMHGGSFKFKVGPFSSHVGFLNKTLHSIFFEGF